MFGRGIEGVGRICTGGLLPIVHAPIVVASGKWRRNGLWRRSGKWLVGNDSRPHQSLLKTIVPRRCGY